MADYPDQNEDQGITAYHGSPYEFDQFDISKIGTGEGAQAYGHGLYFAEAEPVAEGYRDKLIAGTYKTPTGEIFDPYKNLEHMNIRVAAYKNIDNAIERAKGLLEDQPENAEMINRDLQKLYAAKEAQAAPNKGHMYEVRINAHPDHFLDWDRPIKEQPYIMKAIDQHIGDPDIVIDQLFGHQDATGRDLHERLGGEYKPQAVSQRLSDMGIKGIKYLDQGSRGAGEGSRNYVVFDDKLVTTKRRYAEGGEVESYPLRNHHDWEEAHDYEKTGGKLGYESPKKYLHEVKPLNMDHDDKKLIHHFKKQMKKGEKMDPVAIYPDGHPNGRHRAHAAEDLGIKKIPVVKWPKKKKGGGPVVDKALMVISRRRAPPGTPG
jgi:hypothetical protein